MTLVDRENGRGAAVTFCDTEDDLRKAIAREEFELMHQCFE